MGGSLLNITMDLSEVLLFLELIKKEKRNPSLKEFHMMVCILEDYDQVKEFNNKIIELNLKPQIRFYTEQLIHFIEDYEDGIDLKNKVLQRTKKKHRKGSIFMHLILLSKTREQAASILNEAVDYGIKLDESWDDKFDSMWQIKLNQEVLKESLKKYNDFSKIYQEFCEMKIKYFDSLSLKKLKELLIKWQQKQQKSNDNRKFIQTSVYSRSVYVKEFAKRAARGICQLCDFEAPFLDKQGNPFLEVHHIHYLARGGSDTIDNVVALCPNCHRKIHQLELQEDLIKINDKALMNLTL